MPLKKKPASPPFQQWSDAGRFDGGMCVALRLHSTGFFAAWLAKTLHDLPSIVEMRRELVAV